MEELDKIIKETQIEMKNALSHLEKAFSQIRAGKANPMILEDVKVEYYGELSPINHVAEVVTLDALTLSITPYEKSMLHLIEKAIINSNLSFNPTNKGEKIHIHLPILTEETRKEMIKKRVKPEAESTKVSIRNIRKEAIHQIKKIKGLAEDVLKTTEDRIQKITDEAIKSVEEHFNRKQKEVLTI